jgi:guanine nucleotide-binding protein subunit alpha
MGASSSRPDRVSKARSDEISRASKARSDEIDQQIVEDSKRYKKECKILLLGSRESGKSNIARQMKTIHQKGSETEELLAFRPMIHRCVVESAQAIVLALRACGFEGLLAQRHQHLPETILHARPEEALTHKTAEAIEMLWWDPVIARILDEHATEFYLMDSAK